MLGQDKKDDPFMFTSSNFATAFVCCFFYQANFPSITAVSSDVRPPNAKCLTAVIVVFDV